MLRAVLFDLDGTLLDRDTSIRKFVNDQYVRLHASLGHINKNEYMRRFIELDDGGYVWKDKVYQQLVTEIPLQSIAWEKLMEDYLVYFKKSCTAFPNLIPLLEELKSKQLAIGLITNGKTRFQLDNIRALGIEKYFDVILVSEWEGIKKPDRRIFERALSKLGVGAENSIFIGDHPINDIAAAQQAGMKTIWKRAGKWKDVKADYTISDLAELLTIKELCCTCEESG
ncbi:HAD family hydrolase [Sediminibacillus albus]|uniref:Putative hydrolase of the HAD superfamily n=1 Tax=Sediminibacillus albus TaxID=407036 RepID=A0A1G8X1T4_9BACI|nr:HAD family hydrolase [Sediminibacillus albus]SDJ84572.1 putative hydrolase of the HAD superfamily [Sediminibacillus albus]